MNTPPRSPEFPINTQANDVSIAQLVGQVFAIAPPAERSRLLEHLLKPLGVLSLMAIANGIFASIRFRSGWPDIHVRTEDAQNVQPDDVITLVDFVQQVSAQAVDGLADMLASSAAVAGSAAAVMLIALLVQRSRNRRAEDRRI